MFVIAIYFFFVELLLNLSFLVAIQILSHFEIMPLRLTDALMVIAAKIALWNADVVKQL